MLISSTYMGVETLVRLAVQSADKPCSPSGSIDLCHVRRPSWRSCARRASSSPDRDQAAATLQGPGGGYVLARPAHRITVAEIFEAVDAPSDLANRPLNADTLEDEDIRNLHGTDLLWEALKSYVLLFLNGVSLADLAPETDSLVGDDINDNAPVHRMDMDSTVRH